MNAAMDLKWNLMPAWLYLVNPVFKDKKSNGPAEKLVQRKIK